MAAETAPKPSISDSLSERPRTIEKARTGPRPTGWKPIRFLKQLFSEAVADNIDDVGAMMAYYAVMAIFPMLVFIVTIAMLVVDANTVSDGLKMAASAMPSSVSELVINQVYSLLNSASAGFAIGGAMFALWGASRGASSLMNALNSLYGKKETRGFVRRQLTAIGVTLAVALLVIIALGLLVAGPHLGHLIADRFGLGDAFDLGWSIARWVGAGLLVMIVWATLYRFLPNTDAPFRIFTPGAIVGVALWLGISYVFGLYLSHFNSYEATYGALGGAIIFLTWLWLSNVALLFGAELNDVLADFRKHESAAAAKLADETR